jgi:hypothetical protein
MERAAFARQCSPLSPQFGPPFPRTVHDSLRQRVADVACLQHGIEIVRTPMHFPVSRARSTAESRNAGARVAVLSFVSFERSPACERLNRRLAALLATTALVAVAVLVPGAARAQDATWLATPGSGDFNTAAN